MEEYSTIINRLNELELLLNQINIITKPFLTVEELSVYLGLKISYIWKMTHNCEIPHYKPSGKRIYFKREEIDEWVLSSRIASQDEVRQEARRCRRSL